MRAESGRARQPPSSGTRGVCASVPVLQWGRRYNLCHRLRGIPAMSTSTLPNATLTEAYRALTPGSAALAAKAQTLMPSGLAHDSRHFDPYPLYVERALGPVKWDVDNNKYVDYFGGHGALIPGPHITRRFRRRCVRRWKRGTHFGALPPIGGALGGTRHPNGAVGRTGALHVVRDRGDAAGPAPRPRLHGAFQAGAVPRPFSRLAGSHDQRPHQSFRWDADQRRGARRHRQRAVVRSERCRRDHAAFQRPQGYRRRHSGTDRGGISAGCRSCPRSCRLFA